MSTRAPGRAAAGILLVWYALTAARGLMWFDTAEFALVGAQWGLGHPPGQPLYTVLLGLAALLPGDPLVAMNFVSVLCAALCVLPAERLMARLTEIGPRLRFALLLAVGAMTPVWDQATRIELYAPATLLVLLVLDLGQRAHEEARLGPRTWLLLGALTGLIAGFNPVFALLAGVSVGLLATPALLRAGPLPFLKAVGAAALTAGLVTGLAYLYVWQVRGATHTLVWGPLQTGADWLAYLGGRDYAHTEHGAWGAVPGHFALWCIWLAAQGALPVFLTGLLGWCVALRRHLILWALPMGVGAAFAFTYGEFHPQVPDYNGYLMPALWMGAIGAAGLLQRVPRLAPAMVGLLLLSSTVLSYRPVWQRTRAGIVAPRSLATATLDSLPERALLLVESDHLVFPLMYLQSVEGRRRDVVVFNTGFGASSWYWRWLRAQHPDLPEVPLAAPNTTVRLQRLIAAAGRPVHAESVGWAFRLRAQPCPATWSFALGRDCEGIDDAPEAFEALLQKAVAGPAGVDLISRRVLAAVGLTRAAGLWALGDASGALRALKAPLPEGGGLPVPVGLKRPRDAKPLRAEAPVLIGHPDLNRRMGAAILALLERPEAPAWLRVQGDL